MISRTLAVDYDRRVKVDAQPRTSKARILDAALDVLVEVDYERASISEISRRAGLPVGSIYHHFGSKAGVFAAVSTELSQHFWAAFEHTATSPSATIAQRLQEFVDDTRNAVLSSLPMFALNTDLTRLRSVDPELDTLMAQNSERSLNNITTLLIRILRPDEPDAPVSRNDIPAIARVLSRYSRGVAMEYRNDPEALAASFDDYHLMLRRIARLH